MRIGRQSGPRDDSDGWYDHQVMPIVNGSNTSADAAIWLGGQRLGGGSFDAIAGSLAGRGGLLDFRVRPHLRPVILDPATGEVVS
jgi:hypothetical protein